MCEFKDTMHCYDLTLDQQQRFDAHARGEDGEQCQRCREKYFDPAFYGTLARREA